MKNLALTLMSLVFLAGAGGCIVAIEETADTDLGEFAIYLAAVDIPLDDGIDLSQIELASEPVLTDDEIVWYDANSHVIRMEPAIGARLDALELPGRAFIVTIDRTPIYAGAFMAAYFSRTYDGVVILWPPMDAQEDTLRIQLGYPGEDFFTGEDPRSDARIFSALQQAGKLR